jgi:hypothetical protein
MSMRIAAALLLALLPTEDEKLGWSNYARLRDAIAVTPTELSWQRVEWKSGFWSGLVDAQAKDKPILLWLYEGDPRGGC